MCLSHCTKQSSEVVIMKSLIQAVAIAAVLAVPMVSFAQSNQPVTRAQVREELIQLEKAGYNPATANDYDYPANIQAAQARVAAQNGTAQAATAQTAPAQNGTAQADNTGYGPSVSGASQAGVRTETTISTYSPPVYNAR
jgi:hypothetical protein